MLLLYAADSFFLM